MKNTGVARAQRRQSLLVGTTLAVGFTLFVVLAFIGMAVGHG